MRTKAGPKKVTRPKASQERPAQAKLTKSGRVKGSWQIPAPVMKRGPGRPKRSQQDPAQTPVIKRGPGRWPKRSQQDPALTPAIKRGPGRPKRSQQDPAQTPAIKRGPGRWPKRSQQDPAQTPVIKGGRVKRSQQDPAQTSVVRNLRPKGSHLDSTQAGVIKIGPGSSECGKEEPAQTTIVRNLRPKRSQQDPAQAEGIKKGPGLPKRSQEGPAQAKVIRRPRQKVNLRDAAKITGQGKRGGKRKRPQDSVAHSSQPDKQAAKGRKGRAMQRQAEVWPTVQDSLDIDFEHWNPDEIAQQWNARARAALGGGSQEAEQALPDPSFSDLTTEDMGQYAPGPSAIKHDAAPAENVARAAFKKRKTVAIPDDELARLGLPTSSAEAPEAAKLFWAGEELKDVGAGRFYPCRYVREEGDMPIAEWMQKEAQGILPPGDYDVMAILDERKRGTSKEYIVKWKGFELNAEQWLPRNMLVTTKAMQAWAQKRAVDGQWHASSHAEWARLSARAAEHPVDKKAEIDSGRFQQVLC